MLICSPAGALGKTGSPERRAPAASNTRQASRTAKVTTHHPTRGAVAGHSRPHAELLAFGAGYSAPHGSSAVRRLQRRLVQLGYSPGRIDGRYGPLTERAVRGFQTTQDLPVDGLAGPLTLAALVAAKPVLHEGSGYVHGGSSAVRQLQRELAKAGDRPGRADGRYGPLTQRAVMRFQRSRHLPVDGIAGPKTLGHLKKAVAERPQHQRQRVRPRPGTTPGQSRPTAGTSNPTRTGSPRPRVRTGSPQPHVSTRSPGSILWIIAVLVLLGTGLGIALWRRQPGGGDESPAPATEPASKESPSQVDKPPDPYEGAADFQRGLRLLRDGDRAAALEALRRADDRGHRDAAYALAQLLAETGDSAGVKSALQRADERGHSVASFELGVLLLDERDRAGAEDAFRRADHRGEARAACNLGVLLEQRGEVMAARAAYRRADAGGDAVGACNLGALLEQEGDHAGAREAYRRADERGDALGAYGLGVVLQSEGDRAGAAGAYRRARQRGPVKISRAAHEALLGLAGKRDDPQSGRPPEVQVASEPGSGARSLHRQNKRT